MTLREAKRALQSARAALSRADADFNELRISVSLGASAAHLDDDAFHASLRCCKAIDAIDEAVTPAEVKP